MRRVAPMALLLQAYVNPLPPPNSQDDFAMQVKAASDSCSTSGCATSLSSTPAQTSVDVRAATRRFVAEQLGVDEGTVTGFATPCGGANFANCATVFMHSLFKGDGCRGSALAP